MLQAPALGRPFSVQEICYVVVLILLLLCLFVATFTPDNQSFFGGYIGITLSVHPSSFHPYFSQVQLLLN